ncbi:MAG: capsid cement protein [Phycisphaerae bacterium]
MSQIVNTATKVFTAGAAIGQYILVKLVSGKTQIAGLGDEPVGTMEAASFADGDARAVRLLSAQGTLKCVANGAFAQGAVVYGTAGGKIDDVAAGAVRIGIALEAAAAAGDVVEVMPG